MDHTTLKKDRLMLVWDLISACCKAYHYLGVYLKEKGGSKHVTKQIKEEIKDFTNTLSHKRKLWHM